MRYDQDRIPGIRWHAGAAILLAFFCVAALAQTQPSPAFEVVSVRPAAPQPDGQNRLSMRGGPGTSDPGQISYTNVSLMSVLRIAYGAYFYQIDGPSWLGVAGYDITAKIPPGTTKEQFNGMLVSLLAERFHLRLHHESRNVQGFELVTAKSGSKLRESTTADSSDSDVPQSGPQTSKTDGSGFPQLDHPGVAIAMKMTPNAKTPSVYMTFRAQTLSGLVRTVGEELGRPVIDKTGLVGKYDFTLQFVPDTGAPAAQPLADRSDDSGPGILTALSEQLGPEAPPAILEVASVRQHSGVREFSDLPTSGTKVTVSALTLSEVIANAYHLRDDQIVGGPRWLAADLYDIVAKAEGAVPLTAGQSRQLLQTVLAVVS